MRSQKISRLINELEEKQHLLRSRKVTAGFDGFIDTIVKIIKTKEEHGPATLFSTIDEFGNYIVDKRGTSLSLEVEERSTRLGGNLPITAHALGMLGAQVNCIGAFGYPQINSVYNTLSPNCHLYSFSNPGTATAFEFNDGKIMLAQMGSLNNLMWDDMKEIIGIKELLRLYQESDLLCVLNWSEIDASTDIWKGLLSDILPAYKKEERQTAFFDLSDCSKRSKESLLEMLALLQQFSHYTNVILSLNKNEARHIYQVLFNENIPTDLNLAAEKLFGVLFVTTLLLHHSKEAIAVSNDRLLVEGSFFVPEPLISTGAGDNFNAGFSAALLMGLSNDLSLLFANAVSGFYVSKGRSPGLVELISFLKQEI
jgi:sugar/nucleoside kinase (ribokinase family)